MRDGLRLRTQATWIKGLGNAEPGTVMTAKGIHALLHARAKACPRAAARPVRKSPTGGVWYRMGNAMPACTREHRGRLLDSLT